MSISACNCVLVILGHFILFYKHFSQFYSESHEFNLHRSEWLDKNSFIKGTEEVDTLF